MTSEYMGWRLQVTYTMGKDGHGYGTGAEIVEGRKDWAHDRAVGMCAEVIARYPAGVVVDCQCHCQRVAMRTNDIGGVSASAPTGDSFTVEVGPRSIVEPVAS